jgi:hypothetical protein
MHNEELLNLFTTYYLGNQIIVNEMDGAFSMHGIDEKYIQNLGG